MSTARASRFPAFALTALLAAAFPLRAHVAGMRDPGFVADPAVAGFRPAAVQPDGKILVINEFTNDGEFPNGIARLLPDGTMESRDTFHPDLNGNDNDWGIKCVAVQPDGKILIGGNFSTVGGETRYGIARLHGDGSVESTATFNPGTGLGSASEDEYVSCIALQPDGKILLGGRFIAISGEPRGGVARLNPNGTLDTAFVPGVYEVINSIAIEPPFGRIVLGGRADGRPRVVRLHSTGNIDGSFTPPVFPADPVEFFHTAVNSVALQRDGKILMGGLFLGGIRRVFPNGAVDSFASISNYSGEVDRIIVQADGKTVMGGSFSEVNGQPCYDLARLLPDGTVESTDTFVAGPYFYEDTAVQADGKLLVRDGSDTIVRLFSGPASQHFDVGRREWIRSGTAPEIEAVTIEFSLDGGTTWTLPGPGGRITGGWGFGSLNLPPATQVRLRGRISGGVANGSLLEETGVFSPAGNVDAGFNPGADATVWCSAVQADGRMLIGGSFTSVAGQPRHHFARLNVDGTLESTDTFNPGSGGNGNVLCMAVQSDGKIILGGGFTTVNGEPRQRIARLLPDGSLEDLATFNPGPYFSGDVFSLFVQSDGKILVGGSFSSTVNGQTRRGIARLNSDGTLEDHATFNPGNGATGTNSAIFSVIEQPDGKILIGGQFQSFNGQPRNGIARLMPDGSVESTATFNPGTGIGSGQVTVAALQADGRILVGGSFTSFNGQPRNGIARLLPDGTLESTATFNPVAGAIGVPSIVLQADGKIVLGGALQGQIGRLHPDGSIESGATYNPGTGANSTVFGVALQGDGSIVIGGSFASVNNQPRNRLARLSNAPAVQSLVVLNGSRIEWRRGGAAPEVASVTFERSIDGGASWSLLGTGARMAGGWKLTGLNLTERNFLLRARGRTMSGYHGGSSGMVEQVEAFPHHSTDVSFAPDVDGSVHCVAVQSDGKVLIGGTFTSVNGQPRYSIARLEPDGSVESTATFNPGTGVDGLVYCLAVQADRKILIGGDFSTVDGQPRHGIARLLPDGTVESTDTFDPGTGVDGYVRSLTVQPDGRIIIGGTFLSVAGEPRSGVARLLPNGAVESTATFDQGQGFFGYVNCVALQGNGRILLGGLFFLNDATVASIVRLLPNGALEPGASFAPPSGIGGTIETVAVQPDGKTLVGGSNGIFRLLPNGALEGTATFNPGSVLDGTVKCMALQADGRIVCGGDFTATLNGHSQSGIARFMANGTIESGAAFDTGSGVDGGTVLCTAIQADGKILLGGEFTSVNGRPHARLARLLNDPGTQSLTNPASTRILWTRGGTLPETQHATFEFSGDGGGTWISLGEGVRVVGGWSSGNLNLPAIGLVRARGRTLDGAGSPGIIENVFDYASSSLLSWRQQHFGSQINSGAGANAADPDLDGIDNFTEFALGMIPTRSSVNQWPNWQINGDEYRLTLAPPTGRFGLTFLAEWNTTLDAGSWTSIPNTGTSSQQTFCLPIGTDPRTFLRLRVTVP